VSNNNNNHNNTSSSAYNPNGSEGWDGPHVDDNWAGAVSESSELMSTSDLDAAEQLALFARERAELVWSNNLVRKVCEAFVNGTTLQW
jgi:hypothetical protein